MMKTDSTLGQDCGTESNCVCMYIVHCRVIADDMLGGRVAVSPSSTLGGCPLPPPPPSVRVRFRPRWFALTPLWRRFTLHALWLGVRPLRRWVRHLFPSWSGDKPPPPFCGSSSPVPCGGRPTLPSGG